MEQDGVEVPEGCVGVQQGGLISTDNRSGDADTWPSERGHQKGF